MSPRVLLVAALAWWLVALAAYLGGAAWQDEEVIARAASATLATLGFLRAYWP